MLLSEEKISNNERTGISFSKDPKTHSWADLRRAGDDSHITNLTPAKTVAHLKRSLDGNKQHLPIQKHISN